MQVVWSVLNEPHCVMACNRKVRMWAVRVVISVVNIHIENVETYTPVQVEPI